VDLELLAWLESDAGQAALAVARDLELSDTSLLRDVEQLRRRYGAEHARALAEQVRLRRRAAAKFPQADRLFFEAEALEQATSAVVAAYRAQRFPSSALVADLGCGLGGDALALAARGPVVAVDRDPLRLALVAANARALGLTAQVQCVQRDLVTEGPPSADALFCDPARRTGGKRIFDVAAYQPPLETVLSWRAQTPSLAVKLAPGIDPRALPADCELEFISRNGELKEALLWCGPLAQGRRRATLLVGEQRYHLADDVPIDALALAEPAAYLYEPDPAVLRAGLVAPLGRLLGAAQLDSSIAYLTSSQLVATPFARAWPIREWLPWSLKRLRQRLRDLDVGAVAVKKRGSPLDADALARQLRGSGTRSLVVVLTRLQGNPVALICDEPLHASDILSARDT
jgi:SAM-dependent methyltransferase